MTGFAVWLINLFNVDPSKWATTDWALFSVLAILTLVFIIGLFSTIFGLFRSLIKKNQKVKISKQQEDLLKYGKGICTFTVTNKKEQKTGIVLNDAHKVWYFNPKTKHYVAVAIDDHERFDNSPDWERVQIKEATNAKL
ncbi:hypothetical protein [[Mycoplasma] testudinis]|uniref:hypothetical protein n=1 Tax=[Mycoplasma] testudinis TaxID=33924 RepID=UPI0004829DAF|nr:hypothetical protein [[Mycoplasma] testudinis]